jgi:hypothetical protein
VPVAPRPCLVGGSGGNTLAVVQRVVAEASVLGLDTGTLAGSSAPLRNANFSLAAYDANANVTLCTPPGTTVTFTATYTFHPLVSLMFGPGSITISAQTTMQIE